MFSLQDSFILWHFKTVLCNLLHVFQIRYSADVGQLKFLQALTKVTTQRVEFACNNGTRETELDKVIKILGMNGKEVPRKSRWPRLDIRTDCKVRQKSLCDAISKITNYKSPKLCITFLSLKKCAMLSCQNIKKCERDGCTNI